MLKYVASLALAATLISPMVNAASDGVNPWKQCGLGAMIFDDNGTAAAISNIIWDLGTTAVTTKISSVESCNGKNAKTAMFIQQSYNNIIEETAQGQGKHLTAMLDLLEVDQQARASVLSDVRSEMAVIVSNTNYATATRSQKAESYYNALVAQTK